MDGNKLNKWRNSIFCILLIVSFIGCGNSNVSGSFDGDDLTALGNQWHLSFPRNISILGFYKEDDGRAMDSMVQLLLKMDAQDVEQFISDSPFANLELSNENRGKLGADYKWWQPSKVANLRSAQVNLNNGEVLNIGIDSSLKDKAVIYLFWYEI
ncbi:hypothetical protein OLMES_0397 [Oleiphilus messinensis]|uniref:Lipoprotein n=1 Tax=Oleiphilus messinensis TaxID=141451 RepID=A0A1Y0I274_9GAMM|nr:hypothetical protein [Oleiphilus messinensis]ARU54501.1 hypothetical protein OLMES_0397 [Oleiphilus messinensis]